MLAFRHRSQQLAIRASVLTVLSGLWRNVSVTRLADTIQPFADAAAIAANNGFTRSARAASAFYLAARPEGITTVAVPEIFPPPRELTASKLRGASLAGILRARRAGFSASAAAQNGFVRMAGTASGVVLGGGRETIREAAALDPASTGRWRRVAGPNACPFCQTLADRGAIYQDESTSGFAAHDHCSCTVDPEFA